MNLMPFSSTPTEELPRCHWCVGNPLYQSYHDQEWGKLIEDDATLFEFLILEGAQAGLSWITILQRREFYREAFDQFDYKKIANYSDEKMAELMSNPGIIRNKAKILSSVQNAQAFIRVQEEYGSFFNFTRTFFPGEFPLINRPAEFKDIPVKSDISMNMSASMKKKGFSFFGPIICYAHLQATGAINDHVQSCYLGQGPA